MTKKMAIGYTFLFLFAFTFALSFTLASSAQAEWIPAACCVYEWCPRGEYVSVMGHWVKGVGCVYTGEPPCDQAYICPS